MNFTRTLAVNVRRVGGRIPLFWRLQALGWPLWYALFFPEFRLHFASLGDTLLHEFLAMLVCVLLTLPVRSALRRCRRSGSPWRGSVAVAVAGSGIAGWIASMAVGLAAQFLNDDRRLYVLEREWQNVLVGSLKLSLIFLGWSLLYFAVHFWLERERLQKAVVEAGRLVKEKELHFLHDELMPHFLFNGLNILCAQAEEDSAAVRRVALALTDFLKFALSQEEKTTVRFRDELAAIRAYLAVQEARFEGRWDVSYEIQTEAHEAVIPGLALQVLVENAVKFGRETSPPPLRIRIRARQEGARFHLEVANTGKWVERDAALAPPGYGLGLENLKRRLQLLFPDRSEFHQGHQDGWVTVGFALEAE